MNNAKSCIFFCLDFWPIPRLQKRQQRITAVYFKTTGPGSDDVPEKSVRTGAGADRDLGERPRG